jgi:hypothetical protein
MSCFGPSKTQLPGKDPETAAFFKVYMRGINDDNEVAYDGTSFADGDEDDAPLAGSDMSEDENGHISTHEIVTAAQLRQEIREKAKSVSFTYLQCESLGCQLTTSHSLRKLRFLTPWTSTGTRMMTTSMAGLTTTNWELK